MAARQVTHALQQGIRAGRFLGSWCYLCNSARRLFFCWCSAMSCSWFLVLLVHWSYCFIDAAPCLFFVDAALLGYRCSYLVMLGLCRGSETFGLILVAFFYCAVMFYHLETPFPIFIVSLSCDWADHNFINSLSQTWCCWKHMVADWNCDWWSDELYHWPPRFLPAQTVGEGPVAAPLPCFLLLLPLLLLCLIADLQLKWFCSGLLLIRFEEGETDKV